MNQGPIKYERLKSRKRIQFLFSGEKSVKAYPILAVYDKREASKSTLELGVSVSKRRFKRAVDRNRIKRQMREAFRLHSELLPVDNCQFSIMLIYLGKEMPDYALLDKKIISVLKRLASEA